MERPLQLFLVTHTYRGHAGDAHVPLGYAVICAHSQAEATEMAEVELLANGKTDVLKVESLGFPVSPGLVKCWEIP